MAYDGRQLLGKSGEELACAELRRRGYAILERRYRTRFGEIDIIARDGEVIAFVEVKARVGRDFGGGAAAVTPGKQRKVSLMAIDYIARRRLDGRPCRFDVVTVEMTDGKPTIEVFRGAFDAVA
jgi:putative endonuclease